MHDDFVFFTKFWNNFQLFITCISGFNSALAIQVNSTRQDVRITKEKLREEERQNREAQQSLEHWSREVCHAVGKQKCIETNSYAQYHFLNRTSRLRSWILLLQVESERQLLFEAMAYLNDDVRSPVPDIEKIQSDIKRLKDFIAYKVKHSDEERDQYRTQSSSQGHSPSKRGPKNQSGEDSNVDDTTSSKPLLLNDKDRSFNDSREQSSATGLNQLELERIKSEALRHKEEAVIAKGDAEESRSKLDRSEAEAASFIGRIGDALNTVAFYLFMISGTFLGMF